MRLNLVELEALQCKTLVIKIWEEQLSDNANKSEAIQFATRQFWFEWYMMKGGGNEKMNVKRA